MNRATYALLSIALLFAPSTGRAEEEALDRAVVKNRLFQVAGRLELSASAGFMPVTFLTDHYTLTGTAGLNLLETLGIEARGGFALTRQTGLARQVAQKFLSRDPEDGLWLADDLAGAWEMKAHLTGGLRWAPVYGKLSLLSELPVHFQAYLSAGVGTGLFHRQSLVYCQQVAERSTGTCADWLTESRPMLLGTGSVGFRFFTHRGGGIRLELRNYLFPDAFRLNIDRRIAEAGGETGESTLRGLSHLVLFDLGYTFIF